MRKPLGAAMGSAIFFVVAPGVVAGLVPWWLTGWQSNTSFLHWAAPLRLLGWLLLGAGVVVLVRAFVQFAVEGLGTPAPIAPTEHLVVGGLYRYVRNPMYLAVMATLVGQGMVLGQPVVFRYAAVFALAAIAFVRLYEEPTLSARFGSEYAAYRDAVPGWWPRRHPWFAGHS